MKNVDHILRKGLFTFHGSYTSKILAARKEKEIPGAFILERGGRYYVLKPKTVRRRNKGIRKKARSRSNNPGVLVYRDITRIEGTKGKDSQFPRQKFFHNFKKPYPVMIGLPDGSLLIRSKR